jgi:uncharacterized protein (TIGR02145 family)
VTYEGKVYNTVQIGTQCWLKENLNVGTRINGSQNQTNNSIKEKYCFNDLETNCDVYGGLYQWDEAMQYSTLSGTTGICPSGWHIPTDQEITSLTTYLGGESAAGGKMKETGTSHWTPPNTGATNSSEFTALPGGGSIGGFVAIHDNNYVWSSTEGSVSSNAWYRDLDYALASIYRTNGYKSYSFSIRCIQGTSTSTPTVTTNSATNITSSSASSGGIVITDGGASVTARGVCWSISSNPTTANSHTTDGSGTGTFTSNLTGLSANTLYYVRAYATNAIGTAYGNEATFTTTAWQCGDPINYDGKNYNTVQINTQCWFKDNLNIGNRINGTQNQANNGIKEKYCYNDLESNCDIYGGLYQWDEAVQYSTTPGVQGLCPAGWHIPSDAEWTSLTNYLGGESIAGGKMKETGTLHWSPPNTGATNESGFTALPGSSFGSGTFSNLGNIGLFWTSTEHSSLTDSYYRELNYNMITITKSMQPKARGFSTRCVKN